MKQYKIQKCFNIWNIMDQKGYVARQCSTYKEAKDELNFFNNILPKLKAAE